LKPILEQEEKTKAKRKNVLRQIRKEKTRRQREFLTKNRWGFKTVLDQMDHEVFGL